jgi:ABC-type sugar transport system ATPase subunit
MEFFALRIDADQVMLGSRPEHPKVSDVRKEVWLQAAVYVTELMGSETLVFLEMGPQRIVARAT